MEVIYIEYTLESCKASNGYYFIVGEDDIYYFACKLEKGIPKTKKDGTYNISNIVKRNPVIHRTDLIYKPEKNE
jgi:hypothetical protein